MTTTELKETIKVIAQNATTTLQEVSVGGAKQTKYFEIDCSMLIPDYHTIDIRKNTSTFQAMFTELAKIKGPALYYFEIISEHTPASIVYSLEQYSKQKLKSVPAVKKNFPKESKILYVGKVKKNIWGRVIQHFGYYPVSGTQGLQLCYWANNIGLSMKLTIIEFEHEMSNLVGFLENELAIKLKPILGKHK